MKRLTYISKFSRPLTFEEIETIRAASSRNNAEHDITGVLLCLGGLFFQILEGDEAKVDEAFRKISSDGRHAELLCLKSESGIRARLFPQYSMKVINLDINEDIYIQPIKTLLQNVTESHRILEKYTQPTIFKIINTGTNPLLLAPHKVERIVLFSDIVAFSTFVDKLPVEEVIALINNYFTVCTRIITAQGGEVTKFIGDCVMAYFDGDAGDAAIRASLQILDELALVRAAAPRAGPLRMLHTGIGLAKGTVIEGNIGSAEKKDYTIIGDAVNIACRLEALTRQVPQSLVFSAEVKASARDPWPFVHLRQFQPKGKAEPMDIYSVTDAGRHPREPGEQFARAVADYLDRLAAERAEALRGRA